MQMFNKLLVAFLSFALSLVPLYSYALGAASEQSGNPGFFSSPSSATSKESPTSRIARDASGRVVGVGSAVLSRDAAGRVTHMDAPGHHTRFHYDSEASIQPSAMTRDGVTYRITRGANSVRLVPMQKLLTEQPTEEELIAQAMDFMGTCAAEPECMGGGGPDIDLSIGDALSNFATWLAIGGFIGSVYEVGRTILAGAASDEAIAIAAGVGFFEGEVAVAILFMGYGLGTIVYNSVGNYIWINWTP